jgi:Ca-activated chloride channel family protein
MKPARVITIVVAIALVIGALVWRFAGGDDGSSAQTQTTATQGAAVSVPAGGIEVSFAYSPEKQPLIEPLVAEFNGSGAEVDGRPVRVRAEVVSSGESTDLIARGRLQPVLWSPASSLWGRLLNFRTDSATVPDENPSLVRTPLVIAMWEPLARAIGWPKKALGWSDILREAQSPRGWAAYGHPEWGKFKFGHTNPDFSTSGLSAVVAEYYVATGKSEGLMLADIAKPAARQEVRDVQKSVVHYGDTTVFFAEQMAEKGPSYVSAVAMEEVTLLDFNLNKAAQNGKPKLAAIYPKEGTFFSDNPLIVPDAPWVDAAERAGAEAVIAFLRERVTPQKAAELGFRPADPDTPPVPPVTAANLVDPAQPKRVLGLPEPKVLNAITEAWRLDRKPATVRVVLDISGSMNDEGKLDAAKEGLLGFLRLMQPQDRVGLIVFSDDVTEVSPPVPLVMARRQLIPRIRNLIADGNTAVYDATERAVTDAARGATDERINAVVVLTDGEDNQSRIGVDGLVRRLSEQSGSEGTGVRVFTIAYGSGARGEVLERIAKAGGGKAYTGDPETIEKVYQQIASFF